MISSNHPLVAFIVGFGKGMGAVVAEKLKSEGFTVAVAGRSVETDEVRSKGYHPIKLDVADITAIPKAFERLENDLGPAALVVYNAYALKVAPAEDPFSLSISDYVQGTSVTGFNAFAVAKKAVEGFDKLPADTKKAFIGVGNILPFGKPWPALLSLGLGKKALCDIVQVGAEAYGPLGKRFYFAQQVTEAGGPINGADWKYWDLDAHADVFYRLWQQDKQGEWDVRFEKGGKLHV
ncbi:hypothetical protein FRC02_001107 [Tulasnella sp. 418]|nr:hypothetical protein FRC02_001107 [Tulasnella sp. 418]